MFNPLALLQARYFRQGRVSQLASMRLSLVAGWLPVAGWLAWLLPGWLAAGAALAGWLPAAWLAALTLPPCCCWLASLVANRSSTAVQYIAYAMQLLQL